MVTFAGGATPLRAIGIDRSTRKAEISLLANRASFAAYNRARSSASVVDMVTVSCLFALQEVIPPNSFITKACELWRSIKLSAKLASEATYKLSSLHPGIVPYSSERPRV